MLDIIPYSDSLRLIQSCALVNDNFMASPISYDLQGQGGGVVMGPGDVVEGKFRWIQIVNDTVIQTMSSTNILNLSDLVSITLPAGLGIGGNFTAITMLSGVAIAYYA